MSLLEELVGYAHNASVRFIDIDTARAFIASKTKVPQTTTDANQRLLNLEQDIQKRIIGQTDAVSAIADAIRISRAGIQDKKKPIASFLFLGPTGVGKTETAKALAAAYFGNEEKMLRFDMSEYSSSEGVANLIGSTYTNKKGAFTEKLSLNPYTLILLDEFEKASQEVHDLFLQILDEGRITNAYGEVLDFRNTIIIATSNAGSDMMYDTGLTQENKDVFLQKIHRFIIEQHIYRPELLNRFTKMILFTPLSLSELEQITELALQKFAQKMLEQSVVLDFNSALITYIARKSQEDISGARKIARVIKEEIESFVAIKKLEGALPPGKKMTLSVTPGGEILME